MGEVDLAAVYIKIKGNIECFILTSIGFPEVSHR